MLVNECGFNNDEVATIFTEDVKKAKVFMNGMKLLASSQFQNSSLHTQYIEQGIRFRKQCKLKTSLDAILAAEANLSKSLIRRLGNIKIRAALGLDTLATNVKEKKAVMNFIMFSRYHQIKKFFMDDDMITIHRDI